MACRSGWTAGWAAILTLVTIADIGWAPFPAFFDHLPRLLSGEAFPMLRDLSRRRTASRFQGWC